MVLLSVGNIILTSSSLSLASISFEISNGAEDMLPRLGHCLGGVLVALVLWFIKFYSHLSR